MNLKLKLSHDCQAAMLNNMQLGFFIWGDAYDKKKSVWKDSITR